VVAVLGEQLGSLVLVLTGEDTPTVVAWRPDGSTIAATIRIAHERRVRPF